MPRHSEHSSPCHSERSEESVFRPSRRFSLFCRCFPRLISVPRYFAPFCAFLPPPVSSFLFCHSEEGLGPPKNLFSARFVSRPRASLSRPHPPPALFPPHTPDTHPPRPAATHTRRTLAAPAPWHLLITYPPPKKTFFLRVFRPCFCRKFLLYLSCRPLYKTYIFTNIYCYTITICMQENIARAGGASRGGGGVFSSEPFFKGLRGLRNGFLWGSSAHRNGRNGRNGRTGGRGRGAAENGREGRRNGTGNRFFGGPRPSSE